MRRLVPTSQQSADVHLRVRGTLSVSYHIHRPKKSRSASGRASPRLLTATCSPAQLHNENKALRDQLGLLQRHVEILLRSGSTRDQPSISDAAAFDPIQSPTGVPLAHTHSHEDQFILDTQEWTFLDGETSSNQNDSSPSSHGDADTFESSSPWPNPLAICSQISALRISIGNEPSAPDKKFSFGKTMFPIELPEPDKLHRLLQVFFREFDCYWPCLHPTNMRIRLSEFLSAVNYGEFNVKVCIGFQHYKIAAILCSALAFGSPFVSSPGTAEWRPGWKYYLQSKQVMQHFEGCGEDDLEVVIYHTLAASFLLHAETLRFASHHVLQGFQSALNMGLNHQNQAHDHPFELASRRSLWWVLYFLDKRITQKSGIAYFIRESEVAVEEIEADISSGNDETTRAFLQSMITHSRLWTFVWDNFFAPNAPKAGNYDEIQMVDARIVILHQKNRKGLHWDPEKMDLYTRNGETEHQIRRRLLVYLVCHHL